MDPNILIHHHGSVAPASSRLPVRTDEAGKDAGATKAALG